MKIWRQLVVSYLALCLAFAGVIGLSPVLHFWIEHGGQGPIHTHSGFVPQVSQSGHSHDGGRFHQHAQTAENPLPTGLFAHSYRSFELPNISLARLCHALCHLLQGVGPAGSQQPFPNDKGGHEHHSLPQMMASGCVDQALDVPLLSFTPGALVAPDFPALTLFLPSDWNAQTPSRGPPSTRS